MPKEIQRHQNTLNKSQTTFSYFPYHESIPSFPFLFFWSVQVSEGSEVRFQSTEVSDSAQVLKESLPHGNEHLLNWAQRKYRAVTSFSELRMTQDIYIKVGEGNSTKVTSDELEAQLCILRTELNSLTNVKCMSVMHLTLVQKKKQIIYQMIVG